MIEYKDFKWDNVSLYLNDKYLGEIYQVDEPMFGVKLPSGLTSVNCYNLTRAKANLIEYWLSELNKEGEPPRSIGEKASTEPVGELF